MTHKEALETEASLSYALQELSPEEQEKFEQHFFECKECAEDVKVTMQLCNDLRLATHDPRDSTIPAISSEHNVVAYLLEEKVGVERIAFEQHLNHCIACRCQVRIGKELVTVLRERITEPGLAGARFDIAFQFAEWIMIVSSKAFTRLAKATFGVDVERLSLSEQIRLVRKQP